jgi:glycerophosphoryl diester phosphodiesterase
MLEDFQARARRYQEVLIRHANVKDDLWGDRPYSVGEAFHYKPVLFPADADMLRLPVAEPRRDDAVMQGLARLEVVRREPERQLQVFGWRTPDPADSSAVWIFEVQTTDYWRRVCGPSIKRLHELEDSADFGLHLLLRLLYLYGQVPGQLWYKAEQWGRRTNRTDRDVNFSAKVEQELIAGLTGFKYWLDEPYFADGSADPKDGKRDKGEMTFWSENHYILFAAGEYLAGQWLPQERFRAGRMLRYGDRDAVRPGDLTGTEHKHKAERRILRYLDDRLRTGFAEFNAPGYYDEHLTALLNLADFALDEQIRTRATMVTDLLLFDVARLSHAGTLGAAAGRAHFKHKACGYDASIGDAAEVAFGTRAGVIVDGSNMSAGCLASSRYAPPDALIAIAQDVPDRTVDRSRVSIGYDDAPAYNLGMHDADDVVLWWTKAAFFHEELYAGTTFAVNRYRLQNTEPFKSGYEFLAKAAGKIGIIPDANFLPLTPTDFVDNVVSLWNIGRDKVHRTFERLSAIIEGSILVRANVYTYRNRHAMLSSLRRWHRGELNFQSQILQATLSPNATVWTTHPSAGSVIPKFGLPEIPWPIHGIDRTELFPQDDDYTSWWNGTVTVPHVIQRGGAAIQLYQPPALQRVMFGERTHVWFPREAFDEVRQEWPTDCNGDNGIWTFGRVGQGYVGVFSAQQIAWTRDGDWKDRELIAPGERNAFIFQIGSEAEFGSFEQFMARVSAARIHLNGVHWRPGNLSCSYDVPGGERLFLEHDEYGEYHGSRIQDELFPRFESRYVRWGRVRWGQYHYTIEHDGHTLTHDFRELRTKTSGATAVRILDDPDAGPADAPMWAVAYRGAVTEHAENTVAGCRYALDVQGADGVAVSLSLTGDGHLVLWHDWQPPLFTGRPRGWAYQPYFPEVDRRRAVDEQSLAELRRDCGYEPNHSSFDTGERVGIDTLADLVALLRAHPPVRHLVLEVRMPPRPSVPFLSDPYADPARTMVAGLAATLPPDAPYDVTLLFTEEATLRAFRVAAPPARFALALAPAIPREWEGTPVSAAETAIEHGLPVAVTGRLAPPAPKGTEYSYSNVARTMAQDVARVEAFNLNPVENHGRQIDALLAWDDGEMPLAALAVNFGVDGLITTDVPGLLATIAAARVQ